jgi:hypothetical protein
MPFPKELKDIRIDHAAVPAHVPKDRVTDNEYFSNKGTAEFQRLIGETFHSIPLADPLFLASAHQPRHRAADPRDPRRDDRCDRRPG